MQCSQRGKVLFELAAFHLLILNQFHRYSGSDLTNLIKDAAMEPLRKAMEATAFKPVGYNSRGKMMYEPCSKRTTGTVKRTLKDFAKDEVQLAALTMVTTNHGRKFCYSCYAN